MHKKLAKSERLLDENEIEIIVRLENGNAVTVGRHRWDIFKKMFKGDSKTQREYFVVLRE